VRMTVKMPRVADTGDEVVVSQWLVAVGDEVAAGAGLMMVETVKALVEVPSPVGGTLTELLVAVDDEVITGTPIVVIDSH